MIIWSSKTDKITNIYEIKDCKIYHIHSATSSNKNFSKMKYKDKINFKKYNPDYKYNPFEYPSL